MSTAGCGDRDLRRGLAWAKRRQTRGRVETPGLRARPLAASECVHGARCGEILRRLCFLVPVHVFLC